MPELIDSFEQALSNAREFQTIAEHSDSKALINLDHFYHWYYFPDAGIYAPAKFIGYRDSTVAGFSSHERRLHDAQEVLARWFQRVHPGDPGYDDALSGLQKFMEQHGAHLHESSREATGGIYLPV